MVVYFLRHASAGQKRSSAKQDEKRPLDKEGVVQSRHIGRLLAAMNVELDAIVSSPLKRATQTAALVANEVGYEGKIELAVAMRPDSRFDSFRIMLEKYQRKEAVMVVGHNPSISEFASPWCVPATGFKACATEWHAPSPFWKATAPKVEASSICSRASRSFPFCTARFRFAAMRRSPSMATASASACSPLAT